MKSTTTKTLSVLLALMAAFTLFFTGCGKEASADYTYEDLGIQLKLTGNWAKQSDNLYVTPVYDQSETPISGLITYYRDSKDENVIRNLATIVYMNPSKVSMDFLAEMVGGPDHIADIQELGTVGAYNFYFCVYPLDTTGLSNEQKSAYMELYNGMSATKEALVLTEPTYSAEPEQITGAFVIPDGTVDLDGNPISKDLFSANTLTMVNIWGTFCNPCIEEMPLLQSLHMQYASQGFAIVGLLGDAIDADGKEDADTIDLGKTILESNSVTYTNIAMNSDLLKELDLSCYPTTIFVDSTGNIVGETIFGALPEEDYREAIEAALAEVAK